MRQTLRRSCAACARSKLRCDLRTPRCSRCTTRDVQCLYVNEPWTAPRAESGSAGLGLTDYQFGSLDPFESYPSTRLPRKHVQRLIHSFVHKIAFEYYPLDLNPTSNPFLVSWWPLALGDPALFHVSLQTACLDEELSAQRGFGTSELLMVDSVSLLRCKIDDLSLAVQDVTMNSVITLAAIEMRSFGKGNIRVSEMHVDGVKRLVKMRGGIASVRETSPLTARMVSWISLLVKGHPQFETQDDVGIGDGIPPVPEWQLDYDMTALPDNISELSSLHIDYPVWNVFIRLYNAFQRVQCTPLPPARLHDLTCFVVHRLLSSAPDMSSRQSSQVNECIRYAIILYMFTTQGPTYYSHAVILNTIVARFMEHLMRFYSTPHVPGSLDLWLFSNGLVASSGTPLYQWFTERARTLAAELQITNWDEVLVRINRILWLKTEHVEGIIRFHWDAVLDTANKSRPLEYILRSLTSSTGARIAKQLPDIQGAIGTNER